MPGASGAPLKILHVFRAPLGGLFRHVLDIARGQAERGHQVGIFCDATTGGTRADAVFRELSQTLALGITRVPMSRYPSLTDFRAQMAQIALRRRLAPDVVHVDALAQLVFTLTDLPGIQRVSVTVEGERVEVPRGDSTLTSDPLTRGDYAAYLSS